jgi:murein DD-endopeptidase MepM/ murein hydrolase activator NlpD
VAEVRDPSEEEVGALSRSIRAAALALCALVTFAGCGDDKPAATGQPAAAPPSSEAAAPSAEPSSAAPSPAPAASSAPPKDLKRVFPVTGAKYGYAREHHDYPASDIITACGATALSVTDGVVLEVDRTDRFDRKVNEGSTRGGLYVSILGDDGVRYYGSHYQSINQEIQPGVRVRAGQPIAIVGRTGDAGACHIHFGLSPKCMATGDWWTRRGVIWPWSYLDSWKSGGNKSPVEELTAWEQKNGCPQKAPAGY